MEKLSFRNKKQDSGDHLMEEGGYSHSPNINNSNNTNNNNNNNSNNKGFSKEEGGMQLTMFSLDLRSLALFRVLAGLMVAVDAVMRSRSLFAHYANLGVWPTNEAINNINAHSFSFHFSNGNIPFQLVLVLVTVLAGLSLMVGYRSKLSSVVVWLLELSVQNRNVLVNNQGDDLLRMLLFWALFLPLGERYSVDRALFLPLGERYSVDAARENERPSSSTSQLNLSNCHLSLSSMCFIAQIMIMYWVGYLLKTGVEWEDGTAMYYLFSIDQYTTPFGYFVLRFPNFLVLLTKVYLWFELLMPVLIVFPIANASARTTACFTSFGLFFFLNLSLELGMFTYAPVLASLALLPSSFWDKMLPSFYSYLGLEHSKYWTMGGSTTLYYATTGAYPANTKFSLQIANTFLGLTSPILASEKIRKQHNEENENENAVEVSDIGRYLSDNRLQWVAVDGTGKRHTRHRAVLALLSENPITSLVVPILFKMEKVVAFTYNFYAFVLGLPAVLSFTSSAIPSNNNGNAPPYHSHSPSHKRRGGLRRVRVSDLVAVGLLLYVLWWNVGTVNSGLMMSSGNQWLGLALRVDQWWSMFAPAPMKDDGWFVIPAKLANGKEVDLMKAGGGPISYEKPTFVSRTFRDHRWRRYLMNLWSGAHQEKRLFYGRYLCRQWNWYGKGSDDKDYLLKTFRIIYLREVTLKDYRVKGPEPVVLWEHQC